MEPPVVIDCPAEWLLAELAAVEFAIAHHLPGAEQPVPGGLSEVTIDEPWETMFANADRKDVQEMRQQIVEWTLTAEVLKRTKFLRSKVTVS